MNTVESTRQRPGPPDGQRGFTLTELLVILGIVAVLASLQLPALAKATGRTKRAVCASNLRQFALALHVYGNEYNDQLPSNGGVGYWAWNLAWKYGDVLTQLGAGWKVMFCPGTGPRFTDTDNYALYNFGGSYRCLGYALTLSGTASLLATNMNPTLTPQAIPYLSTYLPPPLPAKRVLVADATISQPGQNNPNNKAAYNWTDILGGFTKHHTSPHLVVSLPAGGNVVMLDGHVEWRTLGQLLPRTSGSAPVFWW